MNRLLKISLLTTLLGSSYSCSQKVAVLPLKHFETERYLGKWYEIARLDHIFERGLDSVSAEYSMRSDGNISVLNQGYNTHKKRWKTAKGVAKMTHKIGQLKVYFFPLIGGKYEIAYIDPNYQIVVVSGGTLKYLWFMSRTPTITATQFDTMLHESKKLGYDNNKLIFVKQ